MEITKEGAQSLQMNMPNAVCRLYGKFIVINHKGTTMEKIDMDYDEP